MSKPSSLACECSNFTLNWQYSTSDSVSQIAWLRNMEIIMIYDASISSVIQNNYPDHLDYVSNAAIIIHDISNKDAGDYVVNITLRLGIQIDSINLVVTSLGKKIIYILLKSN